MKKIIFVFVLFALLLSACGGRDLSTPASRLVGHWDVPEKNSEYYIGKIDQKTGEGKWTVYETDTGVVSICSYKIESQAPEGEEIDVDVRDANGDGCIGFGDFKVPKDGLTVVDYVLVNILFGREFSWSYIDGKTEYKP